MAYIRGNGPVEVELARAQSWIEDADEDLYGTARSDGVIKEHNAERAAKAEQRKYNRAIIGWVALLGTVMPLAIKIAELLHWIPK